MNIDICSNHEECEERPSQFKLTKGFTAKESVKGHMASFFFISQIKNALFISSTNYYALRNSLCYCSKFWLKVYCNWQVNVVKGLKLYEDVFTDSELCKLSDFVNEIHTAGQNGELSGKPLLNFVCIWYSHF
jgi:hypothetical protein